jgi:ATP-dependent DNA ligase
MERRRFSREFKLEAVKLIKERGVAYAQAARDLEPLARSTSPLAKPLKKRDTTWVEPRFDAEITYAEITDDGMVRHPSFKRLVTS